jgi:hypothetical protein
MFSSDAYRAFWKASPSGSSRSRWGETDVAQMTPQKGGPAWVPPSGRRAQRQAVEALRLKREADLVQWAVEYRVGCALLTLVEAGRPVSDAAAVELMELSGANMATVFKVLDRVRADIANA